MEHRLKHIAILILLCFSASSCLKNADLTGFITSSDKVDERFVLSDSLIKNHPINNIITDNTVYSFFVAGDTHIGGLINFRKFMNEANKTQCNFYSVVGDITTGHKEDYLKLDTFLVFNEKVRHLFIPGNHDSYFDGWSTYYTLFGPSCYSLTVETKDTSDLLIFLDSGNGTLGKKQLSWLEYLLQNKRKNYRFCFVFSHVNLFVVNDTKGEKQLPEELYKLLDLFATNNVTTVFMGHDHRRCIDHFGKTTYITLDAMLDGCSNASYLSCKVSAAGFEYEFVPMN